MKNAEMKRFSISEFAKACGTTKDTLYHYEKQGLLVPQFDENNHYRLYSVEDFHLFQFIAHMRRMGFSVSDIRDNLSSRNVGTYLGMLEKSRQQCLDEISDLQHRYSIISNSLDSTAKYSDYPIETPGVRFSEETYYYAAPFSAKLNTIDGLRQFQQHLIIADSMPEVTDHIMVFHIKKNSLQDGYTPKLSFMTQTNDPSNVPEENLHTRPAGSFLQMFFNTDILAASEEDLITFSKKMLQYAEEHNYTITTDFYCILHIGIFLTDNPKEFLTEFLIGIE